ncbi:unnamed protein product [Strongylus vulgaris]|uniref:7TM GPCR serpentine receptor class x (Srx) domain-containing protein n=1 Tax=Strongylus vulgaris TaxID=40348 RepID=A0A3P7JKP2_STRVU|nr:unnamed protein product [Strongylus vulgaris]
MYCIDPDPIFYGTSRTIAASIFIFFSAFSIALHVLFIAAVRKMAGWESNFAFALLMTMSACAIIRLFNYIVCNLIALAYVDFCTNHHIFTALGSLDLSSYFSIILITVLITTHRVVYTIFATRAKTLIQPWFLKGILVFIALCFASMVYVTYPNDVHYHFVPNLLSYDDLAESNYEILRLAKRVANYTLGGTNIVAYSVIFGYLYCRHSLSFSTNESRMTLQVALFVCIECLYFIYWEFFEKRVLTIRLYLRRIQTRILELFGMEQKARTVLGSRSVIICRTV